ncbi:MAG: DUF192 domain-containing protein [Allosphingosinicella sp.]
MLRPILAAALLAAPLAACRTEPGAKSAAKADSGLELIPLEIRSGGKVHRFTVEVARTEEEQAQGLMYRQSLAPDRGMLFPFSPPRPASFWMKNTFIPLDIIFVRADGSIARIADNTVPQSLEQVHVGEPVAAVLELAGGRAAELGISDSDKVSWSGGPRP